VKGWVEVDCNIAELIKQSDKVCVYASRTEMNTNGDALLIGYTEWGLKEVDVPVLKSWSMTGDSPCRHLVPAKIDVTADRKANT
jgi:hypothetical protein